MIITLYFVVLNLINIWVIFSFRICLSQITHTHDFYVGLFLNELWLAGRHHEVFLCKMFPSYGHASPVALGHMESLLHALLYKSNIWEEIHPWLNSRAVSGLILPHTCNYSQGIPSISGSLRLQWMSIQMIPLYTSVFITPLPRTFLFAAAAAVA